jgi:hypothetical protein
MSLGVAFGLAEAGRNPFSPIKLAPLLWLRSDVGIAPAGGKVPSWADQSGNGHTFAQGTGANQPTYTAGVWNGHPDINGNGGAAKLTGTGVTPGASGTIILVASASTVAAYLCCDSGGSNVSILADDAGAFLWFNGGDQKAFAPSATAGLHQLIVTQSGTTSCVGYYDGVQAFSITPVGTMNHAIVDLFANTAGSNGTTGSLVEVLVTGSVVSPAQVAQLHAYSQAFWGTP